MGSKVFSGNIKEIKLISRTITEGKEYDLVQEYVKYLEKKSYNNKIKKRAIFIEPQVLNGYPDIVVVEYNHIKIKKMVRRCSDLDSTDLKILFEGIRKSKVNVDSLNQILGYSITEIKKSILKLNRNGLLKINKNGEIKVNKSIIKEPIYKVIAIEAKIDKWNEAIKQANNNQWFATESYIMLNKDKCNDVIIEKCKETGIGIILVNGKIENVLKSKSEGFPVSYGSLMFWEWILRDGGLDGDD